MRSSANQNIITVIKWRQRAGSSVDGNNKKGRYTITNIDAKN